MSRQSYFNRMKQVRRHLGASMETMAEIIGVHKNVYRGWELGRNEPGVTRIAHFCEVFYIDPAWLLLGQGQDPCEDPDYKIAVVEDLKQWLQPLKMDE